MESPSRQPDGGAHSPKALEVLNLVRHSQQAWSLDRYTAARWKLRQRIAEAIIPRPSRPPILAWSLAAVVGAVALAVGLRTLTHGIDDAGAVATVGAPVQPRLTPRVDPGSPAWSEVALPDLGMIEISPGEAFEMRELSDERQIPISRGTLRAHMVRQDPARPAVVVTPHFRIVVVGTRFDVHVDAGRSTLEVLEGAVRVEAPNGNSVLVVGGSRIASDDPRFQQQAPPPPTPAFSLLNPSAPGPSPRRQSSGAPRPTARTPVAPSCESLASTLEQRACFERVSRGTDLAAQNALYTLGVVARDIDGRPDRALEHFHAYARRFPTGLLGPEAALAALDLLQRQGRADEAIEETLDFERRFATDTRVPEVALVRAVLLCRDPDRRAEAVAIVERVLRLNPSTAALATRARSRCEAAAQETPGRAP